MQQRPLAGFELGTLQLLVGVLALKPQKSLSRNVLLHLLLSFVIPLSCYDVQTKNKVRKNGCRVECPLQGDSLWCSAALV